MSWWDALTDKVGAAYRYHQEEVAKGKFNYLTTVVPPYIFVLKLVAGSPLRISAIVSGGLTAQGEIGYIAIPTLAGVGDS
jgi:hypothetical protein